MLMLTQILFHFRSCLGCVGSSAEGRLETKRGTCYQYNLYFLLLFKVSAASLCVGTPLCLVFLHLFSALHYKTSLKQEKSLLRWKRISHK